MNHRQSIGLYGTNIVLEFVYGITLGIIVNQISNYIAIHLDLNINEKMIIQLILIICVLYYIKGHLFGINGIWQVADPTDIIFIALFIGSQINIFHFIRHIYANISH